MADDSEIRLTGNTLRSNRNGSVDITFRDVVAERDIAPIRVSLLVMDRMVASLEQGGGTIKRGTKFGFNTNLDADGIRELESKFHEPSRRPQGWPRRRPRRADPGTNGKVA